MNYADPTPEYRRVMDDVAAERKRQIGKGYTPEHDDRHTVHGFTNLSRAYANLAVDNAWHGETPTRLPAIRQRLVQATAILVAAIESIDRRSTTP